MWQKIVDISRGAQEKRRNNASVSRAERASNLTREEGEKCVCNQFIYPAAYRPDWILTAAGFLVFFSFGTYIVPFPTGNPSLPS